MRNGTGIESTVIRCGRSNSGGFPENRGFYEGDVSSEACKESSGEESGYSGTGSYVIDSCSRKRSGCGVGDGLDDFRCVLVSCLGFIIQLVGKILLFVHDEIGSCGEEIGTSCVIEYEGRDVGYPSF